MPHSFFCAMTVNPSSDVNAEVGYEDLGGEVGDYDAGGVPNFAEILGPHCTIQRVDHNQKVLGEAKPDEFQHEVMSRAQTQRRLGACVEHVKDMTRAQKLEWAISLKDAGNTFYFECKFEEAARLYNDCLVALDLDGDPDEVAEARTKLQLPVCTNLAACMIEVGNYRRCIDICNIALQVDCNCAKALYRRGLSFYRLGDHATARPDFEAALKMIEAGLQRASAEDEDPNGISSLEDMHRRVRVYLGHIRRFGVNEKRSCERMFAAKPLYADRPDPKPEESWVPPDDSDEAIQAELDRIRGTWTCCRRRPPKAKAG